MTGVSIAWQAHSPNLTPRNFFSWGHIKSKVHSPSTGVVKEESTWLWDDFRRNRQRSLTDILDIAGLRPEYMMREDSGHMENIMY